MCCAKCASQIYDFQAKNTKATSGRRSAGTDAVAAPRGAGSRVVVAAGSRRIRLPCADSRDLSTHRSGLVILGHRCGHSQQGRSGRRVACRSAAVSIRHLRLVVGVRRHRAGRDRLSTSDTLDRCCRPASSVARRAWIRSGPALELRARGTAPVSPPRIIAACARRRARRDDRVGLLALSRIQRRHAAADRTLCHRLVVVHRHVVAAPDGAGRRRHRAPDRVAAAATRCATRS